MGNAVKFHVSRVHPRRDRPKHSVPTEPTAGQEAGAEGLRQVLKVRGGSSEGFQSGSACPEAAGGPGLWGKVKERDRRV